MSDQAKKLLSAEDAPKGQGTGRKMTAAIIEDAQKKKEVYEFLEDDDDFEEFEQPEGGDIDVEMQEDHD